MNDFTAFYGKRLLMGLMLLGSIGLFSGLTEASESAKILYPSQNHISVTTADHFIIGFVDTSQVATVEVSNFIEKSDKMDVKPLLLTQDFPKMVQRLFGTNYMITRLIVNSKYSRDPDKIQERSAEFLAENMVGLKTFWESKEFQKIYSATVRDTAASEIKVVMQGYEVNTCEMNTLAYKQEFRDYFHLRVKLNPGSNEIVFRALSSDRRLLERQDFTFIFKSDIDKKTEIPSSFQPERFHLPERESECGSCHRIKLTSQESANRSAPSKVCYPCHQQLTEKKYLHGPVSNWNCTFCHSDMDQSGAKFAAPSGPEVADLCYECHQDLSNNFKMKAYQHGPVAAGQCSLCHSPHGSNHPAQLWMATVDLCLTCHGDRYKINHPVVDHPISGVPDPSEPTKELSCVSCHNPHSGDSPDLFYSATGLYQLCQECHQK